MKTKIIFVRHGETVDNSRRIIRGHTNSPLSKKGLEQARKVGLRFKDEHIDMIFSSDIGRAKQTAAEIKQYHNVPLKYDKRLRERNYGTYEGRHADDWLRAISRTKKSFRNFKPKNGESPVQVIIRGVDFVKYILKHYPGKIIMVVAHGTIIRQIVMKLLNETDRNYHKYVHMNTGVTIIEFDNKEFKLRKLNCTKHLKESKIKKTK